MFSWICKRCGRDNPPSASTCLTCGARFDEEPDPETPPAALHEKIQQQSDPQPTFAPPVARPARELPSRPIERGPVSKSRPGVPTWLLTIVSFLASLGIGFLIYHGYVYLQNRKAATSTGLDPAANVARTKLSNPLQKFVEVVGIRLIQDSKRKPEARFLIVNHSPNVLDEMSATVTLWASTSRSEEDSIGTFTFKVPSIASYGSKELTSPLNTKLKFYELPDWQNATAEVQITSP